MPVMTAEAIRLAFLSASGHSDPHACEESILLRQGLFCGRHLRCGGYGLLWFQEEQQIKFYSPQRSLLFSGTTAEFLAIYADEGTAAEKTVHIERRAA